VRKGRKAKIPEGLLKFLARHGAPHVLFYGYSTANVRFNAHGLPRRVEDDVGFSI
jgi:hypothetical protein